MAGKRIVCHQCKSILPPGSRFCPRCGSEITAADYVSDETVQVNPIYLQPGTVLHLKYRINGVIGQGGFGITYDGTDIKLDMHVAIKEYFPSSMANREVTVSTQVICGSNTQGLYEQGMNNFLKEAKNMAKYAGEENFVAVHDYFAENNTAYIIMEFVEGQNLKEYLQQHGRLTMNEAMPIVMPVMNTLEKIHGRNMIHRDVSPSNIMITPDGRVRLLDFGAAREVQLDTQNLTTMSAVYKYGYSPIEQQTMGMKQGPYTDIYALCATIYEMLTGSVPANPFLRAYEGARLVPPSEMGVVISPVQEDALLRGLAVNGADRIQSIAELRDALCLTGGQYGTGGGQYVAGGGQHGNGGQYGGDDEYEGGGKTALKIVLAAAVVVLAAAIGFAVYRGTTSNKPKKPGNTETVAAADENVTEEVQAEAAGSDQVQEQPQQTDTQVQEPSGSSGVEAGSVATMSGRASDEQEEDSGEEEPAEEKEEPAEAEPAEEEQYNFPEGTLSYNGHHYYIYDDVRTNWADALDRCKGRGGYLAVIDNSEENEQLFRYMLSRGYEQAFFGLTDTVEEGSWTYLAGGTSDFRDWGCNSVGGWEPNDADDGEDFAELDIYMNEGHWNDAQFGRQAYTPEGKKYRDLYTYICEWDF